MSAFIISALVVGFLSAVLMPMASRFLVRIGDGSQAEKKPQDVTIAITISLVIIILIFALIVHLTKEIIGGIPPAFIQEVLQKAPEKNYTTKWGITYTMFAFVLSLFISGLAAIIIIPVLSRPRRQRSLFQSDRYQQKNAFAASIAVLLVISLFVFLTFLWLVEEILSDQKIESFGKAFQHIMDSSHAKLPHILLGSILGVFSFYWIHLLLNPEKIVGAAERRAHNVWGVGLIVIIIFGASYSQIPILLERLKIFPTPWGEFEFAAQVPPTTTESTQADIDLERALLHRDGIFLTALIRLPKSYDDDFNLVNWLVSRKVFTRYQQFEKELFEYTIEPVIKCIHVARQEHHGRDLTHKPVEILASRIRFLLRNKKSSSIKRIQDIILEMHKISREKVQEISKQLDDPRKCRMSEEVEQLGVEASVSHSLDPRQSPYLHLALGFLMAYAGNIPGALLVLEHEPFPRMQIAALSDDGVWLYKVFEGRRRFYLNLLHAWYDADPRFLMKSYEKTENIYEDLIKGVKKKLEAMKID
ncbi:MAG: hypothetical protein QNJ92_15545, partial [Alphaproteobacteria bacterium]|nr:hypothetical protein [Alphaproteobacteria bacterium]